MASGKNYLKEVALVFFKLGLFAFGGPAAHIAMMEQEVVVKRKWMSREHFLDLIGATNLIPGPNSTEMTMHCGHERAGFKGLLVAGICFIFPAVITTGTLAFIYIEYGELPSVNSFMFGIKPAVLAIILGAIIKLGKKALKNTELIILAVLVLAASLYGLNEVLALLGAGILGMFYFTIKSKSSTLNSFILPLGLIGSTDILSNFQNASNVFWVFLKVGAVLYGSGYVLFAYLDAELVAKGLLSTTELLDAIAIGQFTPGPVLSTATFIGYQLSGFEGALLATAGIFLPSFVFVALLKPLVPRMRNSKVLRYFLDSVNVSAVAIMLAVMVTMSIESVVDWKSGLIVALSVLFTFGPRKLNPVWIIIGGSILGYLLNLIG